MPEHDTQKRRRIALSPTHAEWRRLKAAAGRMPVASWVLWAALAMADKVTGDKTTTTTTDQD